MATSNARRFLAAAVILLLIISAKVALRMGIRSAAHAAVAAITGDSASDAEPQPSAASTADDTAASGPTPGATPDAPQSPATQAAQVAEGIDMQPPSATGPRAAAMRVTAATNAHTAAMTDPDAPAGPVGDMPVATSGTSATSATPAAAPPKVTAESPGPAANPAQAPAGTPRPGGRSVSVSVDATGAEHPDEITIVRETYQYAAAGRRDPFVSLMANGALRPMIADLRLVGVAYDPTGRNSVGIMRDVTTQEQYRVKVGQTLGRMRTARIQPKQIVFTIEEFGLSRQEVLELTADSTTARKK